MGKRKQENKESRYRATRSRNNDEGQQVQSDNEVAGHSASRDNGNQNKQRKTQRRSKKSTEQQNNSLSTSYATDEEVQEEEIQVEEVQEEQEIQTACFTEEDNEVVMEVTCNQDSKFLSEFNDDEEDEDYQQEVMRMEESEFEEACEQVVENNNAISDESETVVEVPMAIRQMYEEGLQNQKRQSAELEQSQKEISQLRASIAKFEEMFAGDKILLRNPEFNQKVKGFNTMSKGKNQANSDRDRDGDRYYRQRPEPSTLRDRPEPRPIPSSVIRQPPNRYFEQQPDRYKRQGGGDSARRFDDGQDRTNQLLRDTAQGRGRMYEVPGRCCHESNCHANIIQSKPVYNSIDDDYILVAVHVDQGMERKIVNGDYVDFAKLIPKDRLNHDTDHRMELVNRGGMTYFVPVSDRESTQINSFQSWEKAFRVYSHIYMRHHPERASELIEYNHLINSIANTFVWENVYAYD